MLALLLPALALALHESWAAPGWGASGVCALLRPCPCSGHRCLLEGLPYPSWACNAGAGVTAAAACGSACPAAGRFPACNLFSSLFQWRSVVGLRERTPDELDLFFLGLSAKHNHSRQKLGLGYDFWTLTCFLEERGHGRAVS